MRIYNIHSNHFSLSDYSTKYNQNVLDFEISKNK